MKIENLQDLHVLVETARGGSLTAAARALELTPAATSATLKRLETQLGVRLFERSTRAMRLTDAGQTLLDYASRAMDLLQEGEAQATSDARALRGVIRLAAPPDLTRQVLIPWLNEFQAENPGLQMNLSVAESMQDLVRDKVDLALRMGSLQDSSLVARKLFSTQRVLCAAPAYLRVHGSPETPQDLARHNCLSINVAGRRLTEWRLHKQTGESATVKVQGDRWSNDASLNQQWALAGVGVMFKAQINLQQQLNSGALVRLLPAWAGEEYPIHAVFHSSRFVPTRVRSLVDFLALKFDGTHGELSHNATI
ncbi:LysR family transcriptional regulator [Roseateles oligotrophus]|uniref:LysR family transcriptional regulator n=1 Tax=Roseateles oligotrophus TaxID=1769250 RepID=A0ABT2YML6_9BURK|nr:LysR family transcriptional regulator [Roseateles oligotrophus]MCV2371294.1 LysR family transcriptional regulator [Roseateles oligotrophus]